MKVCLFAHSQPIRLFDSPFLQVIKVFRRHSLILYHYDWEGIENRAQKRCADSVEEEQHHHQQQQQQQQEKQDFRAS